MSQHCDSTPAWQVWQSQEVATKFLEERRAGIPGWREQTEVLLRLLQQVPSQEAPLHILDIGCGDGFLIDVALTAFPKASGIALDGSDVMLERARQRFAQREGLNITFILADFNTTDWKDNLHLDSFDAVISSFAIHHSEDARKRELYAEIFTLLRSGGLFANIEHVASASPLGERFFEERYAEELVRTRLAKGEPAEFTETLKALQERLDKSANRLTLVETQLQWLREIGYREVDCYWKYYELAVLAGYR